MKLWSVIVIVAVLLVAGTLLRGQAVPVSPVPASVPGNAQGHFQILMVDRNSTPEIWIFDTQTADAWRLLGSRWIYMGNPTQDPGARLAAPVNRGRGATQPAPILPESPRP